MTLPNLTMELTLEKSLEFRKICDAIDAVPSSPAGRDAIISFAKHYAKRTLILEGAIGAIAKHDFIESAGAAINAAKRPSD